MKYLTHSLVLVGQSIHDVVLSICYLGSEKRCIVTVIQDISPSIEHVEWSCAFRVDPRSMN